MAQESREWYQNDNFETDQQADGGPTGQFKGEEIEFESFMFDGGQSAGLGLTISGPLHLPQALAVAEAPMAPPAPEPYAPFMGAAAPMRPDSSPLKSLRPLGPLADAAQAQAPTPPPAAQSDAPQFSGAPATPPSGPLRHSGPLVDGRTLSSGPLPASSGESQPQSDSGSLDWPGMRVSGNTGPFNTGSLNTGQLGRLNTGSLSPDMADRPQTGPLTHNGNGNGNGHGAYTPFVTGQSQSRLSSLLTTGPLGMRGEGTGPLNPPSRFMQSGTLMPADLPEEPAMQSAQPEVAQFQSTPEPTLAPTPTPEYMPAPTPLPAHPSQPLSSTQGGWSDSSLAAVEDFSMVLMAMNGAWRYTTATSLGSGTLADAGAVQEVTLIQDSGSLYSNPLPAIHDSLPHMAATEVAEATDVAEDAGFVDVPEFTVVSEFADTGDVVDVTEAFAPPVSYDSAPDDMMSWGEEAPSEEWDAEALMSAVDAPASVETFMDSMDAMDMATEVESPVEWPMGMATEEVAPPPVLHTEVSEGTFAGQSLEFESFMFSGDSLTKPELPNMGAFMPAVTAMESAFTPGDHTSTPAMQSVASAPTFDAVDTSDGMDALPFWLQSTGDLSTPKLSDYLLATDMPDAAVASPSLDATTALPAMSDNDIDYSDLPPIDPFDFTALGLSVEEETLGFNTQELSGYGGFNQDPMTATADLQVVASLLGTDPELMTMPSGSLDPMMAQEDVPPFENFEDFEDFEDFEESVAPIAPIAPIASDTAALQQDEEPDSQPTEQLTARSTGQLDAQPRSWTATVTSSLSPDALRATDSLDDGATGLETEGFGVSPFSVSEMNLDDEEQPTEVLNVPRIRRTGPLRAIAAADLPYALPKDLVKNQDETAVQPSAGNALRWSTSWLGDTSSHLVPELTPSNITEQIAPTEDEAWEAQPEETYAQMSDVKQDLPADSEPVFSFMRDEKLKTGSLAFADDMDSEEAGDTATTYGDTFEEQPFTFADDLAEQVEMAAPVQDPTPHAPETYIQPEQPPAPATPHVASVVSAPYPPYQPMQAQSQAHVQPDTSKFDVPEVRFPTSILASGPLPSLDGFEGLHALVDSNPNDVGAHMALAAAYSQVGDADTQLRVYRRVLRNPAVSNKILRLIAEELTDYEADLTGHPHFHQVRGDLYMKQNRYTEAIAEYNKIV